MSLTIVLVFAGVIFLVGFLIGARFEERNLELRERRLARARREMHETADAIRDYGLNRALVVATSRLHAKAIQDGGPPAVTDEPATDDDPAGRWVDRRSG